MKFVEKTWSSAIPWVSWYFSADILAIRIKTTYCRNDHHEQALIRKCDFLVEHKWCCKSKFQILFEILSSLNKQKRFLRLILLNRFLIVIKQYHFIFLVPIIIFILKNLVDRETDRGLLCYFNSCFAFCRNYFITLK